MSLKSCVLKPMQMKLIFNFTLTCSIFLLYRSLAAATAAKLFASAVACKHAHTHHNSVTLLYEVVSVTGCLVDVIQYL